MDLVTGLPVFTNWKGEIYDLIIVIVDRLTKIVYYGLVVISIDASSPAEIIIKVIILNHNLLNSIFNDWGSFLTSKFWSLFYYFLRIKQKLSSAFYLQTYCQTERQNSTMETYISAFVNFEQDHWARFLPMAEFAYNNTKNASTGHMSFELNFSNHP